MGERKKILRHELTFEFQYCIFGQRLEALVDEKIGWIINGCSNPDVSTPVAYHNRDLGEYTV